MDVDSDRLRWDDVARTRLARARKMRGHSQDQCAEALVQLGATQRAAQATVSNWERGKTDRPPDDTIEAIVHYCSVLDDQASGVEGGAGGQRPEETVHDGPEPPEETFEATVAGLTGAPPLNARQGVLLDQLGTRLAAGPPMSESDRVIALTLLRILNLER